MSKTVVLVDDDIDDLEMFCEAVLEIDKGCTCITLNSGQDLLAWIENPEHVPDFIFVDMFMPGLNGMECIQEIRKIKRLESCFVVSYSSLANFRHLDAFNALNAIMLVKPDSYDELVGQIRTILLMDS